VHKHRGPGYRPFLEEYEARRAAGELPAREGAGAPAARRRLPVLQVGA
jgi:hypothetical protein